LKATRDIDDIRRPKVPENLGPNTAHPDTGEERVILSRGETAVEEPALSEVEWDPRIFASTATSLK
jgi:hypothetical protein